MVYTIPQYHHHHHHCGPVAPGPVAPGPVAPGPVAPGPVAPGQVAPGPVAPGPVAPGHASLSSFGNMTAVGISAPTFPNFLISSLLSFPFLNWIADT